MLIEYPIEEGKLTVNSTQCSHILGIDEVGLGACAGPLVVAGVVVPFDWYGEGVRDSKSFGESKKSTAHEKRSRVLADAIEGCVVYKCAYWYSAEEVDAIGVSKAVQDLTRVTYVTCTNAVRAAVSTLLTVMDGTADSEHASFYQNAICFPKADKHVQAVSAASIVAKVARDGYMLKCDTPLRSYGFAQHKGYPTKGHIEAVKRHGLHDEHRRTYGKFIAAVTGRRYT